MVDYKTAIYAVIVTLMKATPELYDPTGAVMNLVRPGNLIDFTTRKSVSRNRLGSQQAGEYPSVKLAPGRFTNTGYTQDATFASEHPTFVEEGFSQPIRRTLEFTITVVSDKLTIGDADPIEEAVQVALIRGGPRLGLAYVCPSWSIPDARQDITDKDEAKGTQRIVTTMRLVVPIVAESSTFYAT